MITFLDSRDCIITLLLNAIIIPASRINSSGQSKKVTIKESMDCMVLHIKSVDDFEIQIEDIRTRYITEKNTLQPLIIVIGENLSDLQQFFVYVDGAKLKFSSFLSAIDCCFKIFHVLHLDYPRHCEGVYTFIQKYFYEITTTSDKVSPKISGLISYFNSQKVLEVSL